MAATDPGVTAMAIITPNGAGFSAPSTCAWDLSRGLPIILQDGANSYVYGVGGQLISQRTASGVQTY
jgi:hypothetical protein